MWSSETDRTLLRHAPRRRVLRQSVSASAWRAYIRRPGSGARYAAGSWLQSLTSAKICQSHASRRARCCWARARAPAGSTC
ncbi:hypothetical protein U91I_02229 [alpha proteobacterium U9-1i]|nr:hypothetical protein U91I_02229 [alpha proteobacterium U9-1i]